MAKLESMIAPWARGYIRSNDRGFFYDIRGGGDDPDKAAERQWWKQKQLREQWIKADREQKQHEQKLFTRARARDRAREQKPDIKPRAPKKSRAPKERLSGLEEWARARPKEKPKEKPKEFVAPYWACGYPANKRARVVLPITPILVNRAELSEQGQAFTCHSIQTRPGTVGMRIGRGFRILGMYAKDD